LRKARILILEDDPTMLPLLSRVLILEGFSTILTQLDREVDILQTIKIEKPDAIFMDVHLGDIDGMHLLKMIRIDRDISGSKILMTSGLELRHECMDAGADGFLMKPFVPSELVEWLNANIEEDLR
jgi:DNA-binding response OmpR family regulator